MFILNAKKLKAAQGELVAAFDKAAAVAAPQAKVEAALGVKTLAQAKLKPFWKREAVSWVAGFGAIAVGLSLPLALGAAAPLLVVAGFIVAVNAGLNLQTLQDDRKLLDRKAVGLAVGVLADNLQDGLKSPQMTQSLKEFFQCEAKESEQAFARLRANVASVKAPAPKA